MQNLLQFLKKFRTFLIFFVLQVFVLSLFVNSKKFHHSKMTNTSSGVIGWFVEKKHNITQHFGLSEANQILMEENARLREQLPETFYQLQGDVFYYNDTLKKQQFEYYPAKVINGTVYDQRNFFTLNRGSVQGIEIGMGVISDNGVVGYITDVSAHYAIAMTVLSNIIQINVKSKRNNEYWLLTWDGNDSEYGLIRNVKRDIDVEIGDQVVTRGGDGIFPEGIPVGTVSEVISKDGEQTIELNIKLAVNYNAVYHVHVVNNLMKDEQLELEQRILENE